MNRQGPVRSVDVCGGSTILWRVEEVLTRLVFGETSSYPLDGFLGSSLVLLKDGRGRRDGGSSRGRFPIRPKQLYVSCQVPTFSSPRVSFPGVLTGPGARGRSEWSSSLSGFGGGRPGVSRDSSPSGPSTSRRSREPGHDGLRPLFLDAPRPQSDRFPTPRLEFASLILDRTRRVRTVPGNGGSRRRVVLHPRPVGVPRWTHRS